MPDPVEDAYERYRDGLVRRHILCSGRYLSEMWLKEFDPRHDAHGLLAHQRAFRSPADGTTRIYVPWIGEDGIVAGGGDNPFLRGGMAMATFAVEYLARRTRSSLRHAERLLRYFEQCEVNRPTGEKTGFFLRCRHPRFTEEIEQVVSQEEILGLVLGLNYLYAAADGHDAGLCRRIKAMLGRLGAYLKSTGYLLLPVPGAVCNTAKIDRGCDGLFLFQWSLERVFQRVLGQRFTPDQDDYHAASRRAVTILVDAFARDSFADHHVQLLVVLCLWKEQGRVAPDALGPLQTLTQGVLQRGVADLLVNPLAGYWSLFFQCDDASTALRTILGGSVAPAFAGQALAALAATARMPPMAELVERIKDPYWRYFFTVFVYSQLIYCEQYGNWYNYAAILHTLLFALGPQAGPPQPQETLVAQSGARLIEIVLLGERWVFRKDLDFVSILPSHLTQLAAEIMAQRGDLYSRLNELTERWIGRSLSEVLARPLSLETLTRLIHRLQHLILEALKRLQNDDVYAAVIYKGLLSRYASLSHLGRAQAAMDSRVRMWGELPAGELANVRHPPSTPEQDQCVQDVLAHELTDWALAPVRYHNALGWSAPEVRLGSDFCWEHRKNRVFASGDSDHRSATGINACQVLEVLKTGRDVLLEAGGLDFLWPRALMAHWLGEPLQFADAPVRYLRAVTCLPFRQGEGFTLIGCRQSSKDWLLLSGTMHM